MIFCQMPLRENNTCETYMQLLAILNRFSAWEDLKQRQMPFQFLDANLTHWGHFRFSLMSNWSCFHSPALIQPPSRASCCLDTLKSSSWFWITPLPPTESLFLFFGVSYTCINTDYLLTLRGVQHGGLPGHWPGRPRRKYHKGDTKYSETSVCESKRFTQQVGHW